MKAKELFRRVILAIIYVIPCLTLFIPRNPAYRPEDLIPLSITLTPAILYLCGVAWCRYLMAAIAILCIMMSLIIPLCMHTIDRTPAFWMQWCGVFLISWMAVILSLRGKPKKESVNEIEP